MTSLEQELFSALNNKAAGYRKLGVNHEGNGIGKADLPQLQDHQTSRRGSRHLHRPTSQAAPGLTRRNRFNKEQSWPVLLALTFRRISTPKSDSPPFLALVVRVPAKSAKPPASNSRRR